MISTTSSTPLLSTTTTHNRNQKRLSLSISPTSSTSSTIANRRRNNKNLSLCLSSSDSNKLFDQPLPSKLIENNDNDINAYPNGPVHIMPFLYLGSEKNTLDFDHLRKLGIGAILNVAAEVNNPFGDIIPSPSLSKASSVSSNGSIKTVQSTTQYEPVMEYRKLAWEHNQDNLVVELKKAIDIIDRARSMNQTILVHCQCGVARSATVIIAYVMKTLGLPMQEAYNHVKQLAPAISPNLGLLFQLREFEQSFSKVEEEEPMDLDMPMIQVVDYQQDLIVNNKSRPKSWMAAAPAASTPITSTFNHNAITKKTTTPNNSGFLLRASSLSAWKRKLTKSTKSIFSSSSAGVIAGNAHTGDDSIMVVPATPTASTATPTTITGDSNNNNWWKTNNRKLSIDSPACY